MRTTRHTLLALALASTLGFAAPADARTPFSGRAEGAVVQLTPGPAGVGLSVVAQGNASQLGLFTRLEEILLDPATGTFTGHIAFTAANGDLLAGTLVGAFTSATTATGVYELTGGSGRFQGASGTAAFVLATPDGIHFTVTFDGSLDK